MKNQMIKKQGTAIIDEKAAKNYTKVNMFTLAHTMTKSIIQPGDNYQTTFGQVLKFLYQDVTITLQDVCQHFNIEGRKARRILRNNIDNHAKQNRWSWKGIVPTKILNLLSA